ncbi:MAG: response regulator, partial [Opitutales bacterium]|nr:response regulator [Opitutales bacterium]
ANAANRWPGAALIITVPGTIPASEYFGAIERNEAQILICEGEEALLKAVPELLSSMQLQARTESDEPKQEGVCNSLPCALAIVDNDGRLTFWNDYAEKLFGLASEDMVDESLAEKLGLEESFILEILKNKNECPSGEVRISLKEGQEMICQWHSRPRPDGSGVAIILEDITKRVQVEQELREAIRAADAAFRAKSEFLAVMSHEIRTPMNSIIGFTELLLDTPVDKRQRDYMEIVRANGITLLELINNVLEFSRIESGKVEVQLAPVDLSELVAGIIDSMWVEASRKGIELFSRIQEDVPQKVMAVELELRRILLNLVSNGVKFTDHGAVQVIVQVQEQPEGGHHLLFQVNDTGIGIDPSKSDRLFKTFSQVDSSSTRRFGGTGLGLAISKKLCEAMGGRMWMQSTPGKGSTFFFTMPLTPADQNAIPKLNKSRRNSVADNGPNPPETDRPLRILVAEDEPMNQLLVKRFLAKLGQKCDLANNGREAVKKLQENVYDVVFMDMQMPEMDGIHATLEVRSGKCGDHHTGVYICALTAYAMAGDHERCLEAGMNDYLSKPLTLPSLRRAIQRVAEKLPAAKV